VAVVEAIREFVVVVAVGLGHAGSHAIAGIIAVTVAVTIAIAIAIAIAIPVAISVAIAVAVAVSVPITVPITVSVPITRIVAGVAVTVATIITSSACREGKTDDQNSKEGNQAHGDLQAGHSATMSILPIFDVGALATDQLSQRFFRIRWVRARGFS
jgi:hypothetical protein